MMLKVTNLMLRLSSRRTLKGKGCDILITHSPPYGIHDAKDNAHVGFRSLLTPVRFARPRFLLHGHTHRRMNIDPYETNFRSTSISKVHSYQIIDLDEKDPN